MFPLLLLFVVLSQLVYAQTLPAKVKSYLDKNYSGWKLSSIAQDCGVDFENSRVSGDFNGDGKTDYAVKFNKGRKGYILAFVSNGSEYKTHILESGTITEFKRQGLAIARKGETYGEIINDNFDRANRRLRTDAPVGGTCEASTYYYVYRNGTFKRAFTSD
mgnify:FL=1